MGTMVDLLLGGGSGAEVRRKKGIDLLGGGREARGAS
jgi:hypothetical protein